MITRTTSFRSSMMTMTKVPLREVANSSLSFERYLSRAISACRRRSRTSHTQSSPSSTSDTPEPLLVTTLVRLDGEISTEPRPQPNGIVRQPFRSCDSCRKETVIEKSDRRSEPFCERLPIIASDRIPLLTTDLVSIALSVISSS